MTLLADLPTPARAALERLLAGNRRFVDGTAQNPHQDVARRAELATGQRPFAVIFGCSDSRVAAEIVFDQGLGDLFVVRTAGQTVGAEVLGSIEYGVVVLGAALVVVLGHDGCGAVRAAVEAHDTGDTPPGFLRDLVERLVPEVRAAHARGETDVDEIGRAHVLGTADRLVQRSRLLAERVAAGEAAVVGLRYALAEGRAEIIEPDRRGEPVPSGRRP
jgi:carbonic anhydrase